MSDIGGDIGVFGQAPERRRSLSWVSVTVFKVRGLFSSQAPQAAHQQAGWAAGVVGGHIGAAGKGPLDPCGRSRVAHRADRDTLAALPRAQQRWDEVSVARDEHLHSIAEAASGSG